MRHKFCFCAVLCLLLIFACGLGISVKKVISNRNASFTPMLIIDAGHGGFDGGATGISGALEKDINLSIAKKLCSMAQLNGFEVIMVRNTDCAVNEEGVTGLRKKKVSDIHQRLKLAQQHPQAIFLSIHQNHFTQEKYWGTQVFFGKKNAKSRQLAQKIQDNIRLTLQVDNKREIKPAEKNLYILYHTTNPVVLIECGFISNSAECQRLLQEDYQQQLAFEILQSVIEFQMQSATEGTIIDGTKD